MSPWVTPVLGGKSGWLLPADAVLTLIFEVVYQPGAGSQPRAVQYRFEHEDQILFAMPMAPA
jgi:hypothetical protein